MAKNLTRAQAERFFNAFVRANVTDSDRENGLSLPRLVEDWDGHRWTIMWDWADYYGFEGGTKIPEFKAMFGEPVNGMVLALYPC